MRGSTGFQFAGDFVDELFGFVPADAAVGDRLSVDMAAPGLEGLTAFGEIVFEHYAGDFRRSFEEELGCGEGIGTLVAIVFVGIGVRAIEHDGPFELRTG